MELDDLRRQWQQPERVKAPPILSAAELAGVAAQQSRGIMAKLRHNARIELVINYALLLAAAALAGLAPALWLRMFGGLLVLVALVCVFYFYRKLGVLRSLDDPGGDLRAHLVRITGGLRALIRFYYRFTLAMIPVTALLIAALVLFKQLGEFSSLKASLLLGGVGVQCAVLYWPVARGTAWYLQKIYGQHLDRLEGQLRELDDSAPTSLRAEPLPTGQP